MEIRQLEYLLTISETESFTRAAESLYISKPALIKSIRSLEQELGFRLFDSKRHITPEGEICARHVAKILAGIRRTVADIDGLKSFSAGTLSLGVADFVAAMAGTRLITDYHQQYPDVHVYMTTDLSAVLLHDLVERRMDLAIVCQQPEDLNIDSLALQSEELVVCCSLQHPLRRLNTVTIDDIAGESLIMASTGTSYYSRLEEIYAAAGHRPHVAIETDSVAAMRSLVVAGCGISILPRSVVDSDEALIKLRLEPAVQLDTYLAWCCDQQLSPTAEAFCRLAQSERL